MSEILLHLHNPLPLFLDGFFWADACSICLFILLMYLIIQRQSKIVLEQNIRYNKGLFTFRTEVYVNYEKHFFV
jgi:hypothetical protein